MNKFALMACWFLLVACDDATPKHPCTPACEGRVCGADGCGADCGACEDGTACVDGAACVAQACAPGCTDGCPQGCFDLGDCAASSADLALIGNVLTAGVYLTSPQVQAARVFYRLLGTSTWSAAPDAVIIPDGRHVTSLFSLAPDTRYEVLALAGDERHCGEVMTLPLTPVHETVATLFVDQANPQAGDGTEGNPFRTIAAAVAVAAPGTDLRVAAGVYHEEVVVNVSGQAGRYVRLLGEPGAVLDGSDPDVAAAGLPWTQDGPGVWSAPWVGDPRYLLRDGQRLYHFTSLAGLEAGLGDDDVPIGEGFFADGDTLTVRSATAPDAHAWQVPTLGTAFALDGVEHVWIEGFTVRYYGEGDYAKGIDVRDSDHVVVRGNVVHDIPSPVWIRRASSHSRVEDNEIYQTGVHLWPWDAVKGTDHENSAITVAGATQTLVRGNHIHELFNGVYSGSFEDDGDTAIAFDVDVYDNTLANITDDGLEPEGACVNHRFHGNTVDRFHNGVSLAPITSGPVWVLRNRFTNYDASAFKFSNDSSGRVWIFHNTCWTDLPDQNGLNVSGYFENMVFRNNLVRGTRYAFEMSQAAGPNDLDWNNWFTTRGAPVVKWSDVRYDTVAAWCAATGLECHGHDQDPGLADPAAGDFSLTADSPNVDRGVRLYGINDDFLGIAPDLGCLESW